MTGRKNQKKTTDEDCFNENEILINPAMRKHMNAVLKRTKIPTTQEPKPHAHDAYLKDFELLATENN